MFTCACCELGLLKGVAVFVCRGAIVVRSGRSVCLPRFTPLPYQVELDSALGIDENASITENMDETTAMLNNSAGMSMKILPMLLKKGCTLPEPERDFIAAGWAYAKTQGVVEPPPDSPQKKALSLADRQDEASPAMGADSSSSACLALTDSSTPPAKKPRSTESNLGSMGSSGTLELF